MVEILPFISTSKGVHLRLLDLRKIARSQSKSARVGSGFSEGEVPIGTSREEKPLPAEIIWSGDGGALRKSSI